MNDRDWKKFFDYIEKIVNARGLTANEKAALVMQKASDQGGSALVDFEEFCAWDFDFEPLESDDEE